MVGFHTAEDERDQGAGVEEDLEVVGAEDDLALAVPDGRRPVLERVAECRPRLEAERPQAGDEAVRDFAERPRRRRVVPALRL